MCRCDEVLARAYVFRIQDRPVKTIPYRCDIAMKCCACAAIWNHGVALSGRDYKHFTQGTDRMTITHHDLRT